MKRSFSPIALGLAFATMLFSPGAGLALCLPPSAEIVWFWPQEGATDVSVYAPVLVVAPYGVNVTVTVDGQGLGAIEPGLWRFGIGQPLATGTTHSMTITATDSEGTSVSVSASFTTEEEAGEPGGAPMLPEPKTWTTHTGIDHLSPMCQAVVDSWDCHDTGQNTLLSLDAALNGAQGWLVEEIQPDESIGRRILWPAECGPPSVFTHAEHLSRSDACYSLKALGASGVMAQFTYQCGPFLEWSTSEPTESTESDGGCRASPRGQGRMFGPWMLLFMAVFWLGRRRSHDQAG